MECFFLSSIENEILLPVNGIVLG